MTRFAILIVFSILTSRAAAQFTVQQQDGRLKIKLAGKPIGLFVWKHQQIRRPFFAQLRTPTGRAVTRNFPPMKGIDLLDHATMHPGLWMAFGKLSGHDFWRNKAAIRHERFTTKPTVKDGMLRFETVDRYQAAEKNIICRQTTSYVFRKTKAGWSVSIDARFSSPREFWFGVQEEMGLGVRVATPLSVEKGGSILNDKGGRNEKGTWGKVANSWDCFAIVDGRRIGVKITSHKANPPVWSHSRDYGLLVANPFPVDRKENRQKRRIIQPGDTFRLRFVVEVYDRPAVRRPR